MSRVSTSRAACASGPTARSDLFDEQGGENRYASYLADQYERATAGWPNKNGKLVTADASRFFNPEDMDDAIRRAMVQFKANPQQSIEVPMGKPIGEGFMRTTTPGALPDYRQSNIVRVNFDMKAGLPYTAFPDVVRNGVTLPVPKF
jgi:hypothetical protein